MRRPAAQTQKKPPVKKAPTLKPPNFPQHELPEPYSRLLSLDVEEPDETFEAIAGELRAVDADAAAQRLVAMALDETFYNYYQHYADYDEYLKVETRMMAPTQAVRALTHMGEAGRAGIEPLLPLLNAEDDYLREELPMFYGAMGEAAIEPLARVLQDSEGDFYLSGGAGEGLTEVAERHPELRDRVVGILAETLANEREDPEINGFLVSNLIDLKAVEVYPIIEQAYEEDRVEEAIVGLREVQEYFGLPLTAAPVKRGYGPPPAPVDVGLPQAVDEDEEPAQKPFVAAATPGRNDPCYCGSGKKYKKCHGA